MKKMGERTAFFYFGSITIMLISAFIVIFCAWTEQPVTATIFTFFLAGGGWLFGFINGAHTARPLTEEEQAEARERAMSPFTRQAQRVYPHRWTLTMVHEDRADFICVRCHKEETSTSEEIGDDLPEYGCVEEALPGPAKTKYGETVWLTALDE